jgi:DNA-binding SARP family transcriptional activator
MSYFIRVIGGWELQGPDGEILEVRRPLARLLAYLALRGGVQQRGFVAGTLWPDGCDHRAYSNLRSTLWHARREVGGVVDGDTSAVWLCPDVRVDINEARKVVRSLFAGSSPSSLTIPMLLDDVLPDWDDDWVWSIRFLHRQLRLQALDRAIEREIAEYRDFSAMTLAREVAVREPDRRTTHRLLHECELRARQRPPFTVSP